MKKPMDLEKEKQNFESFLARKKTCVLSMIDTNGEPFASTAPIVNVGQTFYIYISKIAEHFAFIQNSKVVDVMFVADEAEMNNHFATERARFKCVPKNIGNDGHEQVFAMFAKIHGESMMNLLRTLDFSLFALTPIEGRYVVGFGKAFNVTLDGTTFEHVVVNKK